MLIQLQVIPKPISNARKNRTGRPLQDTNTKWPRNLIPGPSIFFNGGEDRTRTCKRSLAVVFKTTALPIRLPLRRRRERRRTKNIPQFGALTQPKQKRPGCCKAAGLQIGTSPVPRENYSDKSFAICESRFAALSQPSVRNAIAPLRSIRK